MQSHGMCTRIAGRPDGAFGVNAILAHINHQSLMVDGCAYDRSHYTSHVHASVLRECVGVVPDGTARRGRGRGGDFEDNEYARGRRPVEIAWTTRPKTVAVINRSCVLPFGYV